MYNKISFTILFLLPLFLVPIIYADNGPEVYTRILVDNNVPIDGKTPLILVHGNHGYTGDYWNAFKEYFYKNPDLYEKFKLYTFGYDSDVISVDQLAEGFIFWIDEKTEYGILPNTPFVILAHSMGGLVSRSFMEKQLTQGNWGTAGNRVIRLITLGTPHHGSPGANGPSKDLKCLSYNPKWLPVLQFANLRYWCQKDFRSDETGLCVDWDEHNRKDLWWDSYDGELIGPDTNQWLTDLNDRDSFGYKLIPYYGYISLDDPYRKALIDCVNECITEACTVSCLAGFAIEAADLGDILEISNAVIGEALGYAYNDGMVPIESGRFNNANPPVDFHRVFSDYDHGEIKGDRLVVDSKKYNELFNILQSDLENLYIGISVSPDELRVPAEATFSTSENPGFTYEWEIDDPNNPETLSGSTVSHVFRAEGNYLITLTVNTGSHTYSVNKSIFIGKPDIEILAPNGIDSLYREFSIPHSDFIDEYQWNFGDGSPVGIGREQEHAYEISGYYDVTLTLLLNDGSSMTTSEGLFVGPGTRYISGHHIVGNETWYSGGIYHLLGNITVDQGGKLTIEPGVTVKFEGGGQLNVYGTLDAKDVTFTWADGVNQWDGIYFSGPGSSNSRLDGCIIEHADGAYQTSQGILLISNSSPTITGCTIRDSVASYGIWISNGSPTITNTTVSGMANHGIRVTGDSSPRVTGCTLTDNQYGAYVEYLDNNPVFSGNTYLNNSNADLRATGTIRGAISWDEDTDSGYLLSSFTVAEGASLSIASGMTIKFEGGGQLNVYGTIDAKDVTFTWADGVNQWDGIYFSGPGSSNSRLDGCIIEHADGRYQTSQGILLISNSSPTITGCTIRDSVASYGIWISNGSPTITNTTVSGMANHGIRVTGDSSPRVTGCTLTDNQYGAYVEYLDNNPVFSGNTYLNNSNADLRATGTIRGAISWDEDTDSGYLLSSFTVAEGASLSIASGMTIKFEGGGQLNVYGTIDAEDVTFTWADGVNQWDGIYFSGPGSSNSRLDGCIIEHADGRYQTSQGILLISNSSPTIRGCTIRDSVASYGIWISNGSPTITNTTVSGMANHGIRVTGNSSPRVTGCTLTVNNYGVYIESSGAGTYQGNTIAGNAQFGIYNSGTTVVNATNNYWGDVTGPLDDSDDRDSGGWYNPDGQGDRVSDFVEYYPWIGNPDDMDNDSMADDWEWGIVDSNPNDSLEHPIDVLPFDDFDGDGFSNLREFLALSDPILIQNIPLCWSDFSDDGDVDGMELIVVIAEVGRSDCSGPDPCICDLDSNGSVDTLDVLFFSEDFGRTDCY